MVMGSLKVFHSFMSVMSLSNWFTNPDPVNYNPHYQNAYSPHCLNFLIFIVVVERTCVNIESFYH